MKTIGVLGGLGPQATMAFEAEVHRVAQRLIPPAANRCYPGLVVSYGRCAPVRLTAEGAGHPVLPLQVDPQLLEAARALGRLAPCCR
jgi:hypothetical protein